MWPLVKDTSGDRDGGHHNVNLKILLFSLKTWLHPTSTTQSSEEKDVMIRC